jgi:hypothetical protein
MEPSANRSPARTASLPLSGRHCLAKTFRKARQALQYARQAADTFRVAFAVWRVRKGTLRRLKRYPPAHVRMRACQKLKLDDALITGTKRDNRGDS